MINIAWIIDSKYRELNRLYSFKKKLKKKNINLILLNKVNYQLAIKSINFSAVIIPNLWDFGIKMLKFIKYQKIPKVYLYHTECFEESDDYLNAKYPLNELDNIDLIFCHTKRECEYLEKNNFKKYKFTGHYKYFYFDDQIDQSLENAKILNKTVIGVTSTSKYLANPHSNSLIHIINRRKNDNFVKDYLKYEIDFVFFLTRLKNFCIRNNLQILFRPHPLEKKSKYNLLEDDNFKVDYSKSINHYLKKVKLLLNYISSSSYDAILNKVPVLNISEFFDKYENLNELYKFPPALIGKKIKDFDEIKKILNDPKNLDKILLENNKIREEINDKIFNNLQDPLDIIFEIISFGNSLKKDGFIRSPIFLIFILKQLVTNFKNNRYELFNILNLRDYKLLKSMNKIN